MARRRRSSRRNPYQLLTPAGYREFYDVGEIDSLYTTTQTESQRPKRTQSSRAASTSSPFPAASVAPDEPITYEQARTIGRSLGSMKEWCPAAHARLVREKGKGNVYIKDVLKEMNVTKAVASDIITALYDIGFEDDTKEERKAVVRQMLADAGITCELSGSAEPSQGRTSTSSASKQRRTRYYTGDLPF